MDFQPSSKFLFVFLDLANNFVLHWNNSKAFFCSLGLRSFSTTFTDVVRNTGSRSCSRLVRHNSTLVSNATRSCDEHTGVPAPPRPVPSPPESTGRMATYFCCTPSRHSWIHTHFALILRESTAGPRSPRRHSVAIYHLNNPSGFTSCATSRLPHHLARQRIGGMLNLLKRLT